MVAFDGGEIENELREPNLKSKRWLTGRADGKEWKRWTQGERTVLGPSPIQPSPGGQAMPWSWARSCSTWRRRSP
ncbi:hypothetical protein R1flu_010518 [Riccia fluitans]|uniref:Uncharacterized protein n=1 Tax=Riccia fluitans TaxID=41844 RepID=A0ABD1Z5J1_9MARC